MSHAAAGAKTSFPAYKINALMVALFGIAVIVMSATLDLGTPAQPGAGLWPALVAAVMVAAAIVLLVTERSGDDYERLSRNTWLILVGFGLMAAFVVAFSLIGLTLPSLVVSIVWMRFMADESWRSAVIVGVVSTLIYVTVFNLLLHVPIPTDPVLVLLGVGA